MNDLDIDHLLELGFWVQVSPLAYKDSGWVCCVYKRGKKTGNWVSEETRTFDSPYKCYTWAESVINKLKQE